jgi:HEAT repeat protein
VISGTFLIGIILFLAMVVGISLVAVIAARTRRRRAERLRQQRSAGFRLTLMALVAGDDSEEALQVLRSVDRRVRKALEPTAVSLLSKVKGESRAALVQLLEDWGVLARASSGLRSHRAITRASAAELIGYTGRADLAAELPGLLRDPAAHVRQVAVRALGRIGDPGWARTIIDALEDDDEIPLSTAGQALLRMGAGAVAALAVATRSGRPSVRAMAATLIGLLGDSDEINDLVALLADDSPAVASAAATALGRLGTHSVLGPLMAATFGTPDEVRAAAVAALGRVGAPGAAATLQRLVADPVHQVASNSAHALAQLGEPGRHALLELQGAGGREAAYATEAIGA